MLCQFPLYNKVSQLCVYIHVLVWEFPSHLGHHRALGKSPRAIQQVLSISSIYTSISVSQFIPSLFPPRYLYVCSPQLYFCFENQVIYTICQVFPGGTVVKKNLFINTRDTKGMDSTHGQGRSPGEGNVNPLLSHILAWKIPWTEELDGLQSIGSQESDTTQQLNNNNIPFIRVHMLIYNICCSLSDLLYSE